MSSSSASSPSRDPRRPAQLRKVCAWCKRVIAEGDPGAPESHGICAECERAFFPEIAGALALAALYGVTAALAALSRRAA